MSAHSSPICLTVSGVKMPCSLEPPRLRYCVPLSSRPSDSLSAVVMSFQPEKATPTLALPWPTEAMPQVGA